MEKIMNTATNDNQCWTSSQEAQRCTTESKTSFGT